VNVEQAKFSRNNIRRWQLGTLICAVLVWWMVGLTCVAQTQDPVTSSQVFTNASDPADVQSTQQQQQQQQQQQLQQPTTSQRGTGQVGESTVQGQRPLQQTDINQPRQPQVQSRQPEPPTQFQQLVISTTGRTLPIYGASIFSGPTPSTFAPVINIPVTPDYAIGPGDELRIEIWGQVNQRGSFIVDRTGGISLPQVGTIHVAGLRFDQVTEFLRGQLGRVYRNFDLNVNMGQLRSIQVFVVGEARRPGSYTISSLSTLLNALFASGGPLPQGSLRHILLKRGGNTEVEFDLYDLLLKGDKSKDVALSPGDVIFIPPVGPQAAVVGGINRPGIYELRGETTIEQLLELGGGRTNIAVGSKARLERIYEHEMRSIVDVDLSKSPNLALQNADIVTITAIEDRFKNAVTLRGNVANPGRYVWHPGMRISDLIPNKDALITRDYWQRRNQLGQLPVFYEPEPEKNAEGVTPQRRYEMNAAPYGTPQPISGMGSQQFEPSQDQSSFNQGQQTNTSNQTQFPSSQGQQPNQMQSSTSPGGTDAQRRGSSNTTTSGGSSVGSALTGGNALFPVKTNVIMSAPDIDWSYAVIDRQSATDLKTSLLPFNLGKVILNGDQSQNLELLPEDVVTIFSTADLRVPTSEQTRFVILEGEFTGAGVYSVRPEETLRQLLRRAGGFTPDAYLYASEFTRQSTKRVQKQRLLEYADQLEAQAATETAASSARALNERDTAAAFQATSDAREAVSRLRRAEPSGRIVLQLKPDSRGIGSVPDLALEDGDKFVVPRVPSNVSVEGQVYSANAFVYERGRRTIDYLREAGGPDRQADKGRSFVLRADGSVFSQQYGKVDKATIFPGDTIVIPPRLEKRAILRNLVDIATIVGQFGLGIAAINVLK
jgi:polysaccharide export outer membrane protein